MTNDRIYQVVNHHGSVLMTTFDAVKAFEKKMQLINEKNSGRFEVISYPVEASD